MVLQVVAVFKHGDIDNHDESSFALIFSLSIIINFLGSFFLATPVAHIKSISTLGRVLPMSLYIMLTLMNFLLGVLGSSLIILLALILLGMISYYWYSISFFPWGRKFLRDNCDCLHV